MDDVERFEQRIGLNVGGHWIVHAGVAVVDGHVSTLGAEVRTDGLGDGDRPVPAAGATDADREVGLALALVVGIRKSRMSDTLPRNSSASSNENT